MKSFFFILFWSFGSVLLFTGSLSLANEFPAKGRVFVGADSVNPSELNTEMDAQNIKDFKTATKYGVDITYALTNFLDVGFRYEHLNQKNLEQTATAGQDYQATLTQDAVMGVARAPLWKSAYGRADVFGAVGPSSTTFSIKNTTQDGKLTKTDYASICAEVGGSIGVGFKNVYFYVEGGYKSNQVGSFTREGTISSNVKSIDLSGSYATIGLLFDGITATSK
jgi:hypothetical protein